MTDEPTDDGDEQDVEERVNQIVDRIESADPDNIAMLGTVMVLKEEETFDGEDEPCSGFAGRMLNDDLYGYEDTAAVLGAVEEYDTHLEEIKLEPSKGSEGLFGALKGLLG